MKYFKSFEPNDYVRSIAGLFDSSIKMLHKGLIIHSDIDECEEGTDGCDHNCTNTNGSYYCTCMDGYKLESDNHTCTGDK